MPCAAAEQGGQDEDHHTVHSGLMWVLPGGQGHPDVSGRVTAVGEQRGHGSWTGSVAAIGRDYMPVGVSDKGGRLGRMTGLH